MDLYYATTNQAKVISLRREFEGTPVNVVHASIELPESRSDDVQKIAEGKVRYAHKLLKKPVVALDAGFYIDSLNGFPRAFVNFALDTIELEGILRLVEGKGRSCEFRECLAYLDDSLTNPEYFIAHVRGDMAYEPRGTIKPRLWSKLGLVFIPEGSQKTLAEMSEEEYKQWRAISRESSSPARLFYNWFIDKNKVN